MADRQEGIRFGNWELRPVDSRNWELYHMRASSRGFGDGKPRWASVGRFYQYNSFDLALRYAADCELKDEAHGRVMELDDALLEYERITRALVDGVRDAMGKEQAWHSS